MATFDEYVKQSTDSINQMYDQQRTGRLAELENSYRTSLSGAEAARDKIPEEYQARGNDLAVQYERNKRNLNEMAAGNGLNTGTATQAQLMANQGWMKGYGALRTAQADAIAAADRGIADLTAAHEAKKESAAAEIEASRAEAMLKLQEAARQEQYNRDLQAAQTRASYGDFSGFLALGYDQQTIDNMRQVWIAQNPLLAYNTGAITADQYFQMTGEQAPGVAASGGGGWYAYGGSGSSGKETSDKSGGDEPSASGTLTLAKAAEALKTAASNTGNKLASTLAGAFKPLLNTTASASKGTSAVTPATTTTTSTTRRILTPWSDRLS